jgi:hypothetical protein
MGLDTTFGSAEVETEHETLVTITSTVTVKGIVETQSFFCERSAERLSLLD